MTGPVYSKAMGQDEIVDRPTVDAPFGRALDAEVARRDGPEGRLLEVHR